VKGWEKRKNASLRMMVIHYIFKGAVAGHANMLFPGNTNVNTTHVHEGLLSHADAIHELAKSIHGNRTTDSKMQQMLHSKMEDQNAFNHEVFGNHTTALQMMQATHAEVDSGQAVALVAKQLRPSRARQLLLVQHGAESELSFSALAPGKSSDLEDAAGSASQNPRDNRPREK
jgi:uncharacterized protein YoaH (UPF0181 family)